MLSLHHLDHLTYNTRMLVPSTPWSCYHTKFSYSFTIHFSENRKWSATCQNLDSGGGEKLINQYYCNNPGLWAISSHSPLITYSLLFSWVTNWMSQLQWFLDEKVNIWQKNALGCGVSKGCIQWNQSMPSETDQQEQIPCIFFIGWVWSCVFIKTTSQRIKGLSFLLF